MRVAVGADHAGFSLKQDLVVYLESLTYDILDLGTNNEDPVDYPDYAEARHRPLIEGRAERGVLLCGSGVGASIAANKIRGVRAVMASSETIARYSREHNGANVLTLGATLLTIDEATAIVTTWLTTPMKEPRYIRRLAKIKALEDS